MEHIEKSSVIEAISYTKIDKKLKISFKSGAVHEWTGVPFTKYQKLLEAESKGSYFSLNIKGKYNGVKIKGKDEVYNDIKDFFDI